MWRAASRELCVVNRCLGNKIKVVKNKGWERSPGFMSFWRSEVPSRFRLQKPAASPIKHQIKLWITESMALPASWHHFLALPSTENNCEQFQNWLDQTILQTLNIRDKHRVAHCSTIRQLRSNAGDGDIDGVELGVVVQTAPPPAVGVPAARTW